MTKRRSSSEHELQVTKKFRKCNAKDRRRASPRKRSTYSRHWCFTKNNWKDHGGEIVYDPKIMDYLVFGREKSKAGTPHLQGYVVYKGRKRETTVRKLMPQTHVGVKEYTSLQASNYCKKDGDFEEFGILPKEKKVAMKEKWDKMYNDAKSGKFEDIPKVMLIRYYHAIKRIRQDNPDKPEDLKDFDNYWILAPTRYGKSYYARKRWPDYFDKAPNKWFIGYQGQKTILIDDVGPKQCEHMGWYYKRWGDKYAFPGEDKGGGLSMRPDRIVFTSQYTLEECFGHDPNLLAAMQERFEVIPLERWQKRLLRTDERLGEWSEYTCHEDSWTKEASRQLLQKRASLEPVPSLGPAIQVRHPLSDPPIFTEILDNEFGPKSIVHSSQDDLEYEYDNSQQVDGCLSTALAFMVHAEEEFITEGLDLLGESEKFDSVEDVQPEDNDFIDLTSDDSSSDDIWDFVKDCRYDCQLTI